MIHSKYCIPNVNALQFIQLTSFSSWTSLQLYIRHCSRSWIYRGEWNRQYLYAPGFIVYSLVLNNYIRIASSCFLPQYRIKKKFRGDFPGGPGVRISSSSVRDAGSTPGQEAKIPHLWNQTTKKNRSNIVTNFSKDFLNAPDQKKKKSLKNSETSCSHYLL